MVEKDIENLIAQYPDSFFPGEGFELLGQQVSLGRCRADLLFKDKHGRKVIIEVKRGILGREAAGQIIEYYGLLKQEKPDEIIELILCANIIPSERRLFLERVGIECREIGIGLIVELAKSHSYKFLDEEAAGTTAPQSVSVQQSAVQIKGNGSVWIFQANPKRYDILNALADPELKQQKWLVNRPYKDKIHSGDLVLIWMSGKDSGVYALARVISEPQIMKDLPREEKYWVNEDDRGQALLKVTIEITKDMRNAPLFRRELKELSELRELSIFKFAQGTNFPVAPAEWAVIQKML